MDKENCFELGHITKTHGLEGFVTVFIDSDFPENYYQMESVLLEIRGELIPFFIEDFKETNSPQKVNFLFEEIDDSEKAKDLIGVKLYLPDEVLPELNDNQFYYHEVIGFNILDETKGKIGEIKEVFESAGTDYFSVVYKGNSVLIPIVDKFVTSVDKKNKQIFVNLPDGLLEL